MTTIDIKKYLVPIDNLDIKKIISNWKWLTGDKTIVALAKSGDALLKDNDDKLYFLDVGSGTIEHKADNYQDFFQAKLSNELVEEILLPTVIDKLEKFGFILNKGQIFSFTILPILGGKYDEKNMFALDIYEHFTLTGEIHFQIKDLPDGTEVKMKIID